MGPETAAAPARNYFVAGAIFEKGAILTVFLLGIVFITTTQTVVAALIIQRQPLDLLFQRGLLQVVRDGRIVGREIERLGQRLIQLHLAQSIDPASKLRQRSE